MLEFNKIYKMDCLEGLRQVADNSIDCIVTSPPYNKVGLRDGKIIKCGNWNEQIDYDSYDDNMGEEEYIKWQIDILNECYRILKPTGSMFYNHKVRRYQSKAYFPEWIFHNKLNFYQMITWDRISFVDCSIHYLHPTTELIFWMAKEKPKVFIPNAKHRGEVWKFRAEMNNGHPAPFPVSLPDNCIRLTTEKNDVVLDPFNGSGTTAYSAKMLGRQFIGFEISENYLKMTNDRLNSVGGLENMFLT